MSTEPAKTLTLSISAPTASYQDSPVAGNISLHASNRDEALAALATLRPLPMLAADRGELTLSAQVDRKGPDHVWTTYNLRTDVSDLIARWLDEVAAPLIDATFPAASAPKVEPPATAKTAGQCAFEAYAKAVGHLGCCGGPMGSWASLPRERVGYWEGFALAAHTEAQHSGRAHAWAAARAAALQCSVYRMVCVPETAAEISAAHLPSRKT